MYDDTLWDNLRRALSDLKSGQGTDLMMLADEYYQRTPKGQYSNLWKGAFDAIRCMDNDRITDPVAVTAFNKKLLAAAPFEYNGQPAAAIFDVCGYWPFAPTMTPHVPDPKGLPTVLVMSTTGDPATPYRNGVNLAKDLDARLLTVSGTAHTAFLQQIPCVDQIGNDYLINLKLPGRGRNLLLDRPALTAHRARGVDLDARIALCFVRAGDGCAAPLRPARSSRR